MVNIPPTNGNIIAREPWFSNNIPILLFENDTIKKRPQRKPQDPTISPMFTIKRLAELTGISEYHIRGLCKRNEIPYRKSGVKYLINYETFKEYLRN